jgi:hypothetical protein
VIDVNTCVIDVNTYVIDVNTYVIDVNTYVIDVNTYVIDVNMSHSPKEGAYSPSWPNKLVIIIIILCYSSRTSIIHDILY